MQCVQCNTKMETYGKTGHKCVYKNGEMSDEVDLKREPEFKDVKHLYVYQCHNPKCPNYNLLQGDINI